MNGRAQNGAVVAAIVALTITAAPAGSATTGATLHCHPTTVAVKHTCELHFTDTSGRRDQKVCFSTPAPNKVGTKAGACVKTSKGGRATSVFRAVAKGAATVTATEKHAGQIENTATVTITVT